MNNSPEEKDDLELVRLAKEGDGQAFEVLFNRYNRMVYNVAYRLSGNQADAQDILQDAFVKAARFLEGFRGDSKFTSWLYRITFNVASDVRAKRKKDSLLQAEYTEYQKLDQPVEGLSKDILEALGCLTKEEREAIVLTVYEELKHGEAAKILGCAETTVSWRIFNAKRKLKKYFKQQKLLD